MINVDINFRPANYSAAFVSDRHRQIHIPKFYQISVTCKDVLISNYNPFPSIYKVKEEAAIVPRATINQRITS